MQKRLKQWFCIVRAKKPARIILFLICLINTAILLLTTGIILIIQHLKGSDTCFLLQIYKTLLMMIGAIDINDLIDQTSKWDTYMVFSATAYLLLIFVTMISFTGALIGYLTNNISHFIERSNAGAHPLTLREHTVILNWNSRAAEIINDLLFKQKSERIVVLVQEGKEAILTEIQDRLSDTIRDENQKLYLSCRKMPLIQKCRILKTKRLHNKLQIVVRQGDVFSAERLIDSSLGQAKNIIILNPETKVCMEAGRINHHKNTHTNDDCSIVKLLMQVAEIAGDDASRNNQQIIVEVCNDWIMSLVNQIIQQKQIDGKSNIIAVPVNSILGDILAQVIIMPELNLVYNELFSYRGAEIFTKSTTETNENQLITKYFPNHLHALPLTVMKTNDLYTSYYMAKNREDIDIISKNPVLPCTVQINKQYQMNEKSVIILGHSSKSAALIDGLYAFNHEWQGENTSPLLDIIVIDDKEGLRQNDHYSAYHMIHTVIEADIYNKAVICEEIKKTIEKSKNQISILILSDDTTESDNTDRSVFTYLIYVQSVINLILQADPVFDRNRLDIVVELYNPKNADIIANYNVSYVIISNRYISRLFNHLGEKEALFYFLTDILTFDDVDNQAESSKELYIKRVKDFFITYPKSITASQLIRAVFAASPPDNKAITIGYISANKNIQLFAGDQRSYRLDLKPNDHLILLSNH